MTEIKLAVIGGGLAGSEAAWQAARHGVNVLLYEMRPQVSTSAHAGSGLAELVCSNSLGSDLPEHPAGILKQELRRLGSLLMECADASKLPAGTALAVDRENFEQLVTRQLSSHPNITILRQEVTEIPTGPVIIASGPLTSAPLARSISKLTGQENLYFYDALAPIVSADTINMQVAYRASRYGSIEEGAGDYINCPLNDGEYHAFVDAILSAERIELHEPEGGLDLDKAGGSRRYFEACLPVEIIAQRSAKALTFGPMSPAGLTDPRTGRWPHAVVQLRQDNLAASLYNLVGFQTNLSFTDQQRVFRMIPGLEKAQFVRYGQMHRNTFISSPKVLHASMQFRARSDLFFAGQITGMEGYAGSIASGLLAGLNAARLIQGSELLHFPETTMLGALCHYISHADAEHFQPMKANFGLLPPLGMKRRMPKTEKAQLFSRRAWADLEEFIAKADPLQ